MRIPFLNTLVTFRKAGSSDLSVHELDGSGRIRVNVGNTVNVPAQPTPPTTPSPGDKWLNTSPGQDIEYVYTSALGWVSSEFFIGWGEDSMDSNNLGWAGINTAGTGTGLVLPRDAVLSAMTARIRNGNSTKQFYLVVNGTNVVTYTLASGQVITTTPVQVNAGDVVWFRGNGAGGSVQDIVIGSWWRWRV